MAWSKDKGTIAKVNADYAKVQGDYAKTEANKVERFVEDNKTKWLPAVATVAARNSAYPNPEHGDTVRVTSEAKTYRYVSPTGWVVTDIYDASAIDQVAQQLAHIEMQVQWKTPQQFGAKGDGITDDSEAFRLMVNSDDGKSIRIPRGTYVIASSEKIPLKSMIGEGKPIIKFTHKDGGFLSYKNSSSTEYHGFVTLENLYIHGDHVCDYLITCGFSSEGTIRNVTFGQAKSAFKIDYSLEIVDLIAVTTSDLTNFFEVSSSADTSNALNSVSFFGGNFWLVDNFINTFKGGNVSFYGGWFEQVDRILLKQSNAGGFHLTLNGGNIIKTRGTNALFTLNNNGADKIFISKPKIYIGGSNLKSIIELSNSELNNTIIADKFILMDSIFLTGNNLTYLVFAEETITSNRYLCRIRVDNNFIDYSFPWYNDIRSAISTGLGLRGNGHPTLNHFLGFQLHQSDNQSRIIYDSDNKYLYVTDQNGVNKYPILGLTARITAERASGYAPIIGQQVFDKTLNKPIWYKGNGVWVDANGTQV